jgi:LytS/YehU family sensor histidine kinase
MVKDKEVVTSIMITRYSYIANPIAYDAQTLMEWLENDYKIQIESGTWAPNIERKETTEIAALRAEISTLQSAKYQGNNQPADNNAEAAKRRNDKYVWK